MFIEKNSFSKKIDFFMFFNISSPASESFISPERIKTCENANPYFFCIKTRSQGTNFLVIH